MPIVISATLLLSITFISLFSPSKADILGFSTDLIHRDSPAFPFYDPSLTRLDRLLKAVKHSQKRANHFVSTSKNVNSTSAELIPIPGAYVMKISLGTPPVTMFAEADTGSDITWIQCAPCTKCYKQKAPLFNSKKSSTYKAYTQNSSTCQGLGLSYLTPNDTCQYAVIYGDLSHTSGTLASETLTLGSVYFHGFTFGCGFNNGGTFQETESGLVGLGGGPYSLISQIKPSVNGKFSYCLTSSFDETLITSQINFGNNADVSGTWVASTPIIPKTPKTYYYLNLEALSVGKHKVKLFNPSSDSIVNAGNIIIDSGTTFTYLFTETYVKFVDLVREFMGSNTVSDPAQVFELCYRVSDKPMYPKIQAHFTGASIDLKPVNTFIQTGDDVTCLALFPSSDFQIFGSFSQTNFLVGFDTVKGTVSFKATKCGHVSQ